MILFWLNPLLVFSAAETENAAQPTTLPVEAASDSAIEKRLRAVIDNIDDFQNVKMEGVMAEPAPFMIVEKLGDFSVLVRFFGWIDQRKTDFAKVRGEAIRRVKLALDKAGVNMPAPIQTLRLEQGQPTQPETAATPGLRAKGPEGREKITVDLSPDTQLEDQIKEDLSATHEPNLLTES